MNLNSVDQAIGNKIKKLRSSYKKEASYLANLLKMSTPEFIQHEEGKLPFHPYHLQKIATAFDLSINYFLQGIADRSLSGEQLYDIRVSKIDLDLFNHLSQLPTPMKQNLISATSQKEFENEVTDWIKFIQKQGNI